jgi:hypothetical protein
LKASHLVAHQEKLEEARCRMLGPLKAYCAHTNAPIPAEGTPLQELLNLNADVLSMTLRRLAAFETQDSRDLAGRGASKSGSWCASDDGLRQSHHHYDYGRDLPQQHYAQQRGSPPSGSTSTRHSPKNVRGDDGDRGTTSGWGTTSDFPSHDKSRTSSRSANNSITTTHIQLRLQRAHSAFSAMKESY